MLNLVGLAVPGLTALAVIPPTLAALGKEQFGVVALVWGALVVAGVLDLGIGRALTQKIASTSGADAAEHAEWLRAALIGAIGFSTLLLVVFFGGAAVAMLLGVMPNAVGDAIGDESDVVLLLAVVAPLQAMVVSARGYYEGLGLFVKANLQRLSVNVPTLLLPLICHLLGGGIEEAILGMLLVRVGAIAALMVSVRNRGPMRDGGHDLRLRVRALLSFGSLFSVENVIKGLASQSDRYLIALLGGASMVAVFSVPADLVLQTLLPLGALTTALFPRFVSGGDCPSALASMMRWSGLVFAVSAVLAPLLYWQIENVLEIWLRESLSGAEVVARALIVGLPFYCVASVATAYLHAIRRLKATLGVSLVSFVASLPVMYFLYSNEGVAIMAWYWPAKYVFEAFALLLLSRVRWP